MLPRPTRKLTYVDRLMANCEALLGPKLVDAKNGECSTVEHLEGKYVMLYFSAHWY